jgi:signal recognition particle subunit SRP54
MKQMMEGLGANQGLLGRIPGMKGVATARQLRKQMAAGGGIPGMGPAGMMGMGFPGMGLPGMGGDFGLGPGPTEGMTKMRVLSVAERNAKKAQRKREKDARRKGRR